MGADSNNNIILALIAVVAIVVVAMFITNRRHGAESPTERNKSRFVNWGSHWGPSLSFGYPYNYALDNANPAEVAENRMYSTAEVDPMITGQLYSGPRAAGTGKRFIYGGRTSHGDKWGLHEFSTGVPGQAGVDVGLLGMRDYSLDGRPDVFDDGIPENWRLPSTPVNWYAPQERDYYDVEANGPAVYKPDLMTLQEPDHTPLIS